MTARVDTIELTDEDRARWRFMDNDNGRRAVKHVYTQPTPRLQECITFTPDGRFDYKSAAFTAFACEFQAGTNLSWIVSRAAEVLYERNVIDERAFDRILEAAL